MKGRKRKIKQKRGNNTVEAGAPTSRGHGPRARPGLLSVGTVSLTKVKIQARALEGTHRGPRTHAERARVQAKSQRAPGHEHE